jgi:hypothetical protein
MPQKFNGDRRDKLTKQKHRLTNWAEYNENLRRRGDLTVLISDAAHALWAGPTANDAWWSACLFGFSN